MKPQRLLYLSSHQMTAYQWQRGTLAHEETFSPTEKGLQQFAHYLAHNAKSVFTLLINVAEEGFHIETIPYLRGGDRRVVIQRKLAQAFFNTPLTTAISLGHEKSRRKDERLLLAGLTNPTFLQPWLDEITESDAALSGVHSLPLLGQVLLRKLQLTPEPCLLLSVQDQSIRQSFFEKGELHFSRLTQLQHSSIGGIAQALATESLKLQQYLASQRLVGRNQAITAHILAHPGAFKAIQNSCVDTPAVNFNILDITGCAERVGLKTVPQDAHAESLFLHLLVTNPPRAQFAGDDLRHNFRIVQIRSLLQGAGAMALIACLLLSGKYLFDAHEIAQNADTLRAEAALSRQRYSDIVKTFPSVPTDNETLKSAIDRYLAHERRSTTPAAFYQEISRALEAEPSVEVDRLDWRIGGADAPSGVPGAEAGALPEDSESLIVRGTLRLGANATPRQSLAAFDRFVEALRVNASLQVDILQRPFDVESGKSLRGGSAGQDDAKPHDFGVRVTRKIGS